MQGRGGLSPARQQGPADLCATPGVLPCDNASEQALTPSVLLCVRLSIRWQGEGVRQVLYNVHLPPSTKPQLQASSNPPPTNTSR